MLARVLPLAGCRVFPIAVAVTVAAVSAARAADAGAKVIWPFVCERVSEILRITTPLFLSGGGGLLA